MSISTLLTSLKVLQCCKTVNAQSHAYDSRIARMSALLDEETIKNKLLLSFPSSSLPVSKFRRGMGRSTSIPAIVPSRSTMAKSESVANMSSFQTVEEEDDEPVILEVKHVHKKDTVPSYARPRKSDVSQVRIRGKDFSSGRLASIKTPVSDRNRPPIHRSPLASETVAAKLERTKTLAHKKPELPPIRVRNVSMVTGSKLDPIYNELKPEYQAIVSPRRSSHVHKSDLSTHFESLTLSPNKDTRRKSISPKKQNHSNGIEIIPKTPTIDLRRQKTASSRRDDLMPAISSVVDKHASPASGERSKASRRKTEVLPTVPRVPRRSEVFGMKIPRKNDQPPVPVLRTEQPKSMSKSQTLTDFRIARAESKQAIAMRSVKSPDYRKPVTPKTVTAASDIEDEQIKNIIRKIPPNDNARLFRKTEPIGPSIALRERQLSLYEQGEILDYRHIYFTGHVGRQHHRHMNNFDDENGDYKVVKGDHIAYRYEILEVLGQGSFGKVIKCIDHKNGCLVAVKIILNRSKFRAQGFIEAGILRTLSGGDSMIRYLGHYVFRDHLCITTELLGINLYELLKYNKFKGLPSKMVKSYTKELVAGLAFLASHGIIHCDLKPENILLSENNSVKIIDFGSSCHVTERVYTYIQSRFYRSPEVILGMEYGLPIDMWSLGCILAELYTGTPLFVGEDEVTVLSKIIETCGLMPENHSIGRMKTYREAIKSSRRSPGALRDPYYGLGWKDKALEEFVFACLVMSPERRIRPSEAILHEYVRDRRPLPKVPVGGRVSRG